MKFVLKLCGWYPSRVNEDNGDFVQRQALSIAKQCKTVVFFAIKDPQMQNRQLESEFRQNGQLYEYRYYYPQRSHFDLFWSQYYYMKALRQFLPRLLKEHGQPAIVHLNIVWKAAKWALYLFRKNQWPFVITEHSTEYHPNSPNFILGKSAFRRMITQKAFQHTQLFIPVSEQLAKAVEKLYGPRRYRVVPNAVDTRLFYPEAPAENHPFRLVHISTMGYQKNIEGIDRVIKKLAATDLNFEVVFIGPASPEVKLKMLSDTSVAAKARFTGNIPYGEVASHLRQADALFLFSRYENLPCVILEAHCCGVPVISTLVGGIAEAITPDNGCLIASEDEDALLNLLQCMIKKEILFDKEKIAAEASAKYSYESIGRQMIEAYGLVQPQSF